MKRRPTDLGRTGSCFNGTSEHITDRDGDPKRHTSSGGWSGPVEQEHAEAPIPGRGCGEGADLEHLLAASSKPFVASLVLDPGEL